jgi:capsular polysaccharide biosynthesis protein
MDLALVMGLAVGLLMELGLVMALDFHVDIMKDQEKVKGMVQVTVLGIQLTR